MSEYLTLDYCAENRLTQLQAVAWLLREGAGGVKL